MKTDAAPWLLTAVLLAVVYFVAIHINLGAVLWQCSNVVMDIMGWA